MDEDQIKKLLAKHPTFMLRTIFLLMAIWLFGSCHPTPNTGTSVFLQPAKDKRSLLKMGFEHPDLSTMTLHFGPSALKISSDSFLVKRINDTEVIYTLRDDEPTTIQILVNHVDPTSLVNVLDTLGFQKEGAFTDSLLIFVNQRLNIRYLAYISKGQSLFTGQISNRIKK